MTEVLVVIAIIAALVGVGYPVTRLFLDRSRQTACINNLRSLGVALQASSDDAGGKLPELMSGKSSKNENANVLENFLLPYLESEDVFRCPADRKEFTKTGSSYLWNSTQNGRYLSQLSFFSIKGNREKIPLISDKESWHPNDGTNFLYADLSASNKPKFAVGN